MIITNATSYGILARKMVLYPLGTILDSRRKLHSTNLDGKQDIIVKLCCQCDLLEGKDENLISQLCWLDFLTFHVTLNHWKITSMIKMNPLRMNWQYYMTWDAIHPRITFGS